MSAETPPPLLSKLQTAAAELAALAALIERPPLDDVQLEQAVAIRAAGAIRTVLSTLTPDHARQVDGEVTSGGGYTPGPWMVEPISNGVTYQITDCLPPEQCTVIAETPWGDREDEQNAHLIAAAPMMLNIVVAALPVLRAYLQGDLNGGCLMGADGQPDRATLEADFLPLVTAAEAVIYDAERLIEVFAPGGVA